MKPNHMPCSLLGIYSRGARANGDVQIRFLADPSGAFTKAMDMSFGDAAAIFGGERSKRYAVVVKDGKVASVSVEPDNTGTTVSLADKVLGSATGA